VARSSIDGMYWDFHWPLSLKELVEGQQARRRTSDSTPLVREWFSQPRASSDTTTEVVQVNFRLPLSVGEISFETQRVPVRIEIWYQDRLNNWRQVFDRQRIPVSITLSASSQASWYKYRTHVYPVVAKAVQLRCTRVPDPATGSTPYVIGIRNTLLRRNIYDRNAGRLAFEDELDPIGNVVAKYIKDWDATRAIDDQPLTFWRSAPQPDPRAVVSLYLDTRNPDGSPQLIDSLYIDPVYTQQIINLYYSNDETVGTRKLSAITLPPDTDENTDWRVNRGRWDISSAPSGTSSYACPLAIGPMVRQDVWVGMEWTPDFAPLDGPAQNPVLWSVTPNDPDPDQYWPRIVYDVGAAEVQLELTNGTDTKLYQVALSPLLVPSEPLRIVVGWRYSPETVLISVRTRTGAEIARLEDASPELPNLITLDGQMGFANFRGLFTSHIVKTEDFAVGSGTYQANPGVYVSPDPVIPTENGQIPSTTLDNAVYAVDWTLQTHGSGGSHDSFYENKTWTPIWRDYLASKGRLFLPQSISMRYLKLEFTNLTSEPYPVYDAGVQTTYKVFPIQVRWQLPPRSPRSAVDADEWEPGGVQLGSELNLGYIMAPSVNWLNPSSVAQAVNAIFGNTITPVSVTTGGPLTFSALPSSTSTSTTDAVRSEEANPYVYRRDPIDPQVLAGQIIAELGNEWIQTLTYYPTPLYELDPGESFGPALPALQNPTALPVQGRDWWLFPGGTLAMPATVLRGLTTSSTEGGGVVLDPGETVPTNRIRFAITSIHRYDIKTVTRDAALAYFAGVREVRALSASYIDEQDPPLFEFSAYDPNRWVFNNVRQLDTGPITTAGKVYSIENPGFDLSLAHWESGAAQGWSRDATRGRWHWGSATVAADGTEKNLRSTDPINVTEGDSITFSCWVWWEGVLATDGLPAIVLGGTTLADGAPVADIVFDEVTYPDWLSHSESFADGSGAPYFIEGPDGLFIPGPDATLTDADDDGLFEIDPGDTTLTDDGGGLFTMTPLGPDPLDWVRLEGTWVVPAGVDQLRVRLSVTEDASAGQVWFDGVGILSADEVLATVYKEFVTTSTFAKVRCDFRDSGLVRSDAMWARADPLATNIDNLKLAYYVSTIPDMVPGGAWGDTFGTWGDQAVQWGAPYSLVAISVDPNRIFDGRRVLKFARASGAGNAGIKILQQTNFVADGLVRLCAVFYKPLVNNNQITLRLRRVSDGVFVHEETITKPAVGYWYTHQGQFIEVPDGPDQVYTIELTTTGDAEDELFLADLYTEIALCRYFMRLGGPASFLHDVTPLRYADSAQVVSTDVVNEVSVQAAILSPKVWLYGCSVQPQYLK